MMIRKEFLVAMSVLVLLGSVFLTAFPFLGSAVDVDASAPVTITSDIVVGSGEVEELDSVEYKISADIIVESGGILYVNNSKLLWGGTNDGDYGLYVENGGELYIDQGCNFTAQDTSTYQYREKEIQGNKYTVEAWGVFWKFVVAGKARINNSEFSYMWGETGGYLGDCEGGIICKNDDIMIYNCKIQYVENAGISVLEPGAAGATGDYNGGYSPIIDKVTIDNSTNKGIFVGGDRSAPTITNCVVSGAKQLGIEYFAGSDGVLNDTRVFGNEDGMQFDAIGTSYSADIIINRCNFDNNNGSGYIAGRGGTIAFNNCSFDGNGESGANLQLSTQYGAQPITMVDCTINNNGEDGVTSSDPTVSAVFNRVEVAYNGGNGIWLPEGSASAPLFDRLTVHDNDHYGIYSNGSHGQVVNSIIRDNFLGNVYAVNGSEMSVSNCDILDSEYGIMVMDSDPALIANTVEDCIIGTRIMGDSNPIVTGGEYDSNQHGIHLLSGPVTISGIEFSENTKSGITMEDTDNNMVQDCSFNLNEIGINILGDGETTLDNITITGSVTNGLQVEEKANISVWDSEMMSNNADMEISGDSDGYFYSTNLDQNKVMILDSRSTVWVSWKISVWVTDNQTGENVSEANLVVYTQEGKELGSETTFLDGRASTYALQYSYEGSTLTEYTPVNITVSFLGYVPYWDQDHENTDDHHVDILFAENRPPVFLDNPKFGPVETHDNRPILTWDAPDDWNGDDIGYTVNVWEDTMKTGRWVVINEYAPDNNYTFTKNLRYNKEFWVEILAFDPWGLNDTFTFSFRTINTPPTQPVVEFREAPVPALIDLEIVIVNQSTDDNTNPIDSITYLVEWYAYREETWVMLDSGSNMFMLDHNLTREGDRIKVVIKSFDGIEYGLPVELETEVINFAPINIIPYVDVELVEDTPQGGLVDLDSLFEDRDGDDLSFRVSVQRHISADIDEVTGEIILIPDDDWSGEDYLIVEAYDGKPHVEENPVVRINVTVSDVNDPPVITNVIYKGEEIEVEEGKITMIQDLQGSKIVIEVQGSDPDKGYVTEELEFSTNFEEVIGEGILSKDDDEISFEKTTGRLTIFLKNALVGEHEFNYTITDSQGVSTSIPIKLIVDNVNDAPTRPEITSHTDGESVSLTQDANTITFEASASFDPDMEVPDSDETLEYDWNFGEGWIENQGLSYTREFSVTGEYEVRIRVRDSLGLYEEAMIKINVDIPQAETDFKDTDDDKPFLEEWGFILILVIIAIVVIAVIFILLFRKDKLSDTAEEIEKEHEALVAKQQEEALEAQEKLQALMSGVPYPEATGPALPSGGAGEGGYDALPSAAGEGVPQEGQPPVDQQPPAYDQPPADMQAPPMQDPMQPAPPIPEQAEQTVQAPDQAGAVPAQEEPQQNPYLPPEQ
jgi:hypothetical protein